MKNIHASIKTLPGSKQRASLMGKDKYNLNSSFLGINQIRQWLVSLACRSNAHQGIRSLCVVSCALRGLCPKCRLSKRMCLSADKSYMGDSQDEMCYHGACVCSHSRTTITHKQNTNIDRQFSEIRWNEVTRCRGLTCRRATNILHR